MEVILHIPQNIVKQCHECGFNERQTKSLFLQFINELMSNGYGQFETDFDNWLNGLEEDELEIFTK